MLPRDRRDRDDLLDAGLLDEKFEATGVICPVWRCCTTPELCQNECFDKDLAYSTPATSSK